MNAAGVTADDSSGCVRATADPAGRVVDIGISTSWRAKLGPEHIGRALAEAGLRATLQSVGSAQRSSLSEEQPEASSEALFEGVSDEAANEVLRRAAEELRTTRVRAVAQRERRRELADSRFEGSDERRRMTVELDLSGGVTSVTAEAGWLHDVSTERLTGAVREAFAAAYQALDAAQREA